MQDRAYYEDQDLRITALDIRCKLLTIRTDSVTSVSIASAQPMKLTAWMLVPCLFLGGCLFLPVFALVGPRNSILMLIGYVPLACVVYLGSLVRVSHIYLQTSGGPVVLASKIELTDAVATMARFQAIKDAIEQAMGAAGTKTLP